MKTKKILKDVVILLVLEAIVVGVLFFFSSLALGRGKYSSNLSFDIAQSMLNSSTEYIGVYIPGNKNLVENAPEIPGYRCICQSAVAQMQKNSAEATVQFSFNDEQTELVKDKNIVDIIIVFMDKDNKITLKSQNIDLKTIPHIRDISLIYLSNRGIELNYTYKLEELTAAAMILTFVFYASHVISRNKEEKQSEAEKKAE